jgi:hypothetical protein
MINQMDVEEYLTINAMERLTDRNPKSLDIDDFDIVYGSIEVPADTILYRGYDKAYPVLSNRPAFYSAKIETAESYEETDNHALGIFKTKTSLKIYDLRFIKMILKDLFTQRKNNSKDVIETCYTLALSYGICSFKRQMELLNIRIPDLKSEIRASLEKHEAKIKKYPTLTGIDPVEVQGIRIGSTFNDSEAVLILKEVFYGIVDGYVAPKMYSPYHIEKKECIHPAEIVLFDPQENIVQIKELPKSKISHYHVKQLFQWETLHFPLRGFEEPKIHMNFKTEGADKNIDQHLERNTFLSSPEAEKLENKVKNRVTKLMGNRRWFYKIPPSPKQELAPWIPNFQDCQWKK